MKEWRELFLDREKELKYLHTAWGLAQQGKPQIAVLIGETGLGKTRLVQQFYRDIANTQESETIPYWPTSLQVGRNLILQPEIANSNATIPWLWWSMRFKEPDDRNVVSTTSPFEIDDKNLAANAAPILRQRNVKSSTGKVAESLVTLLADWTGLGLAGQIWEVIGMIKEYKNLELSAKATNNELQLDLVKKLTEKTLNALRLFLDKKISDAPTVPVILVIDDAQWIDAVTLQAL